jgi:protein ImuB
VEGSSRVAYVFARALPLFALARGQEGLLEQPVAVLDAEVVAGRALPGTATVVCCTPAARALGVRAGHTGHQARALAPEVALRGLERVALGSARAALVDAAAAVGRHLEPEADGVWVAVGDLARLHASEGGIANALGQAARKVGLRASVAIARGKRIARLAARHRLGATVIPSGREAEFLARLPLETLALPDALRADLVRLGVRTLADLAALPSSAVGLRLGEDCAAAVRLCRGEDDAALVPRAPPLRFEEGHDFDWEVQQVEPLLFALRALCAALAARLECRALGVGGLVLGCRLASGVLDERVLELRAPTREVPSLVKFLRASLEASAPLGPVVGLRLVALPGALRPAQLGLFDPPGPAPDRLALTLTRLAALVGEERVGAAVAPDTHRPHAAAVAAFDPPRGAVAEAPSPPTTLALHVFRPPREARVSLRDGRPTTVEAGAILGRVVACGGPWRTSGAWWGDPFDHEGYDVELEDGGLYLVAYDGTRDAWQVDGVYE